MTIVHRGFTLLEMVMSLTLGSIVLSGCILGISVLYGNVNKSSDAIHIHDAVTAFETEMLRLPGQFSPYDTPNGSLALDTGNSGFSYVLLLHRSWSGGAIIGAKDTTTGKMAIGLPPYVRIIHPFYLRTDSITTSWLVSGTKDPLTLDLSTAYVYEDIALGKFIPGNVTREVLRFHVVALDRREFPRTETPFTEWIADTSARVYPNTFAVRFPQQ